jgi:hypothetical protein
VRAFALAALVVLSAAFTAAAQDPPKAPPKPADVAGKWNMTLEMSIGSGTPTLEIKQDAGKITGTYTGRYAPAAITGTVVDHKIAFTCTIDAEGQAATMSFEGEIATDGQSMKGSAQIEGLGDATWTAKRAPK